MIPNIYTIIYSTTLNTPSIGNSSSSNFRSNDRAHSYTHLQVKKPYIALNSEIYISLQQQEPTTWKSIGYEFYCEELFVVKHKTKYSCESAMYLDLGTDIMKENCKFRFYYNKMNITPNVLDGKNEIILANWPNDKHIICNINNDIPVRIPSHPYILVNRNGCVIVV